LKTYGSPMVESDNRFAWHQTITFSCEKIMLLSFFAENLNFGDIAASRFILEPWKISPLRPSALSTALCPLCGPLSSLQHSVLSSDLGPLYGTLFPLRPCVPPPPTTLCPLYGPLSPLRPFAFSTALCFLNSPLSCLRALCPLYGPLSSLRSSVPSTALCLLYSQLSPQKPYVPCMTLCPSL
jgi:hypothetical protein